MNGINASVNSPFRGLGGIFIIGFMGSGKTHWGRIWAAASGMYFFDLDEIIEKEENKTIAAIFEQEGEAYFRQKETEVLKAFSKRENCIVACGGGTACFNNNMQWMNDNGTTVYISGTVDQIIERIINEMDKRPVLKNISPEDLPVFIANKLKEREPFYNQAKIILPVNDITADTIHTINKSFAK